MSLRWLAGLVLGLGAAAVACEPDGWLLARGVRAFREVDVAEARRLLAEEEGLLVQVAEPHSGLTRVAPARLIPAEGPLPPSLLGQRVPVVIVALAPHAARQLAARLVRAGVPRVAVVQGGLGAWRPAGAARAAGDGASF